MQHLKSRSRKSKILFFSFLIPRNCITENLFANEDSKDRRISRISRICHCAFEKSTTLTGLLREIYIGINIVYEEKGGNHIGCMQMLLMLLKNISLVSKTFFQIIPLKTVIKDEEGLYYSLDIRAAKPFRFLDTPRSFLRSGRYLRTPKLDTPHTLRAMRARNFARKKQRKHEKNEKKSYKNQGDRQLPTPPPRKKMWTGSPSPGSYSRNRNKVKPLRTTIATTRKRYRKTKVKQQNDLHKHRNLEDSSLSTSKLSKSKLNQSLDKQLSQPAHQVNTKDISRKDGHKEKGTHKTKNTSRNQTQMNDLSNQTEVSKRKRLQNQEKQLLKRKQFLANADNVKHGITKRMNLNIREKNNLENKIRKSNLGEAGASKRRIANNELASDDYFSVCSTFSEETSAFYYDAGDESTNISEDIWPTTPELRSDSGLSFLIWNIDDESQAILELVLLDLIGDVTRKFHQGMSLKLNILDWLSQTLTKDLLFSETSHSIVDCSFSEVNSFLNELDIILPSYEYLIENSIADSVTKIVKPIVKLHGIIQSANIATDNMSLLFDAIAQKHITSNVRQFMDVKNIIYKVFKEEGDKFIDRKVQTAFYNNLINIIFNQPTVGQMYEFICELKVLYIMANQLIDFSIRRFMYSKTADILAQLLSTTLITNIVLGQVCESVQECEMPKIMVEESIEGAIEISKKKKREKEIILGEIDETLDEKAEKVIEDEVYLTLKSIFEDFYIEEKLKTVLSQVEAAVLDSVLKDGYSSNSCLLTVQGNQLLLQKVFEIQLLSDIDNVIEDLYDSIFIRDSLIRYFTIRFTRSITTEMMVHGSNKKTVKNALNETASELINSYIEGEIFSSSRVEDKNLRSIQFAIVEESGMMLNDSIVAIIKDNSLKLITSELLESNYDEIFFSENISQLVFDIASNVISSKLKQEETIKELGSDICVDRCLKIMNEEVVECVNQTKKVDAIVKPICDDFIESLITCDITDISVIVARKASMISKVNRKSFQELSSKANTLNKTDDIVSDRSWPGLYNPIPRGVVPDILEANMFDSTGQRKSSENKAVNKAKNMLNIEHVNICDTEMDTSATELDVVSPDQRIVDITVDNEQLDYVPEVVPDKLHFTGLNVPSKSEKLSLELHSTCSHCGTEVYLNTYASGFDICKVHKPTAMDEYAALEKGEFDQLNFVKEVSFNAPHSINIEEKSCDEVNKIRSSIKYPDKGPSLNPVDNQLNENLITDISVNKREENGYDEMTNHQKSQDFIVQENAVCEISLAIDIPIMADQRETDYVLPQSKFIRPSCDALENVVFIHESQVTLVDPSYTGIYIAAINDMHEIIDSQYVLLKLLDAWFIFVNPIVGNFINLNESVDVDMKLTLSYTGMVSDTVYDEQISQVQEISVSSSISGLEHVRTEILPRTISNFVMSKIMCFHTTTLTETLDDDSDDVMDLVIPYYRDLVSCVDQLKEDPEILKTVIITDLRNNLRNNQNPDIELSIADKSKVLSSIREQLDIVPEILLQPSPETLIFKETEIDQRGLGVTSSTPQGSLIFRQQKEEVHGLIAADSNQPLYQENLQYKIEVDAPEIEDVSDETFATSLITDHVSEISLENKTTERTQFNNELNKEKSTTEIKVPNITLEASEDVLSAMHPSSIECSKADPMDKYLSISRVSSKDDTMDKYLSISRVSSKDDTMDKQISSRVSSKDASTDMQNQSVTQTKLSSQSKRELTKLVENLASEDGSMLIRYKDHNQGGLPFAELNYEMEFHSPSISDVFSEPNSYSVRENLRLLMKPRVQSFHSQDYSFEVSSSSRFSTENRNSQSVKDLGPSGTILSQLKMNTTVGGVIEKLVSNMLDEGNHEVITKQGSSPKKTSKFRNLFLNERNSGRVSVSDTLPTFTSDASKSTISNDLPKHDNNSLLHKIAWVTVYEAIANAKLELQSTTNPDDQLKTLCQYYIMMIIKSAKCIVENPGNYEYKNNSIEQNGICTGKVSSKSPKNETSSELKDITTDFSYSSENLLGANTRQPFAQDVPIVVVYSPDEDLDIDTEELVLRLCSRCSSSRDSIELNKDRQSQEDISHLSDSIIKLEIDNVYDDGFPDDGFSLFLDRVSVSSGSQAHIPQVNKVSPNDGNYFVACIYDRVFIDILTENLMDLVNQCINMRNKYHAGCFPEGKSRNISKNQSKQRENKSPTTEPEKRTRKKRKVVQTAVQSDSKQACNADSLSDNTVSEGAKQTKFSESYDHRQHSLQTSANTTFPRSSEVAHHSSHSSNRARSIIPRAGHTRSRTTICPTS